MYVLGIGGYMHDYNCCLVDLKSKRISLIEAERLSRRKHHVVRGEEDVMPPIEWVCRELDIKPAKIDVVVHGHTDSFPAKDLVKKALPKAKHVDVDHHQCHAAGAFFASPFERALIVSMDGFGDGASGLVATGNGLGIDEIKRISDADSIGLEYLRSTYHIGLGGYGSEGKTQGLAPYGKPVYFDAYMKEIEVTADGGITLSDRLRHQSSTLAIEGGYLNSQILTNRFLDDWGPRRLSHEPLTQTHMDLAASVQKVLETVVPEVCRVAKKRTGETNLVLSGGVTMNSSLNGRLLKSGLFEKIFALPMASDRGIALGAALWYIHGEMKLPRFWQLGGVYFGGAYDDGMAKKAMKKAGLKPFAVKDPSAFAAEALSKGGIVGWVQGRSEMGARALGHRSILGDPRDPKMKDIINERVKHREWFRPFAPAVLEHLAKDYFSFPDAIADLGYMTFTVDATPLGAEKAPATVHVDGTARVQTVGQQHAPDYWRIIDQFRQLTGVPIVLNTSFNDKDEPIVETPENAVATFLNADMDYLVIGNMIASKT